MRTLIWLVLIFSVIFRGTADTKSESGNKVILTSFYPMYIMTLNIAENVPGVKVVNMTQPQTGCLHDYQLTTQDLKALASASILIANGAGMESFLEKAISQNRSLTIIEASKGIELLSDDADHADHDHADNKHEDKHLHDERQVTNHDHADEHKHHDHGALNPHVWVSVSGAIEQVRSIANGLASANPENTALYQANAKKYIDKLEVLKKAMHDSLKSVASSDIITFHEAFPYFAKEFNLSIVTVIEREPGSEPSAAELARIIQDIRKYKVKALFVEPQYPQKTAQTLSRETGVGVFTLDPAVTGPMVPDAYITIMQSNTRVLMKALR